MCAQIINIKLLITKKMKSKNKNKYLLLMAA